MSKNKKVIVPLTSNELIVQAVLRNWFQDPTGFNNVGTRDFKRAVQVVSVLTEKQGFHSSIQLIGDIHMHYECNAQECFCMDPGNCTSFVSNDDIEDKYEIEDIDSTTSNEE